MRKKILFVAVVVGCGATAVVAVVVGGGATAVVAVVVAAVAIVAAVCFDCLMSAVLAKVTKVEVSSMASRNVAANRC